jgi:hypothetical protein
MGWKIGMKNDCKRTAISELARHEDVTEGIGGSGRFTAAQGNLISRPLEKRPLPVRADNAGTGRISLRRAAAVLLRALLPSAERRNVGQKKVRQKNMGTKKRHLIFVSASL